MIVLAGDHRQMPLVGTDLVFATFSERGSSRAASCPQLDRTGERGRRLEQPAIGDGCVVLTQFPYCSAPIAK